LNRSNEQAKVSVLMITFNHEQYIQQAIEGVIMQQCDSPFELVIGEDFSTDSTRKICEKLAKQYKNVIRLLPSGSNLGMLPNFIRTLKACKGEYIAFCEGDDYWTDPFKLQKQIQFLKDHPRYTICYHKVMVDGAGLDRLSNQTTNVSYSFSFTDSLQWKHGATLSCVFVRDCIDLEEYTCLTKGINIGDWPIECLCTLKGDGYFIGEIMGTYRVHAGNVTKTFSKEDYFINRIIFANRLKDLDAASLHKDFIISFINRIYLSRIYSKLTTSEFKEALLNAKAVLPIRYSKFYIRNVKWRPALKLHKLLIRFPIGLIIGLKNSLKKPRRQSES